MRTLLTLFTISLLAPLTVSAQDVGGLEGRVLDARTLTPVSGASVTLLFQGALSRTTVTSDNGEYRVDGLDEGIYQVLVELTGYQPALQQDARVVRGKVAVYDFEITELRISESCWSRRRPAATARASR